MEAVPQLGQARAVANGSGPSKVVVGLWYQQPQGVQIKHGRPLGRNRLVLAGKRWPAIKGSRCSASRLLPWKIRSEGEDMSDGNKNQVQSESWIEPDDKAARKSAEQHIAESDPVVDDDFEERMGAYLAQQEIVKDRSDARAQVEDMFSQVPAGLSQAETDAQIEARDEFVSSYVDAPRAVRPQLVELCNAARALGRNTRRRVM